MLTLCTVLHHLAMNRTKEAADLVAHRLKSVEMSTADGDRNRARFVELIPAVPETLTSRDEIALVLRGTL